MLSNKTSSLKVAIIGSGPAGIYAADSLIKSKKLENIGLEIDIFDKMPTPFGLIRYGVAPDHPRIKGIIKSLHKVMEQDGIRFFGNVDFGKDIFLEDLQKNYNAIIFATGAYHDKDLDLPGIESENSFGAADFVAWYDANPDFPKHWTLNAEKIAILGVGNVALDIARVLAKTADEMLHTEIADHIHSGLKKNLAKEIHVFGRRGPAQAKFSPLELKELNHSPNISVVINPEDIEYDEASHEARKTSKITDQVSTIIENYAIQEEANAPHKIFIHFFENPLEIISENNIVVGIKTARMEFDNNGGVIPTGEETIWNVDAVYKAIGYKSLPVTGLPFDNGSNTVPHLGGRVLENSVPKKGIFVTGWIKRGPIGLIGSTKSDASETIENLIDDFENNNLLEIDNTDFVKILDDKNIIYTTWDDWVNLDNHEKKIGEKAGRERIKIVERDDMIRISKNK